MDRKYLLIAGVALIAGGLIAVIAGVGRDDRGVPAFRRARFFNASDRKADEVKLEVYRGATKIKTWTWADVAKYTGVYVDETAQGFLEGNERTTDITNAVISVKYTNGTQKTVTVDTLNLGNASAAKIDEIAAAFDAEYGLRAVIAYSTDDRNPKMLTMEDRKLAP